MLDEPRNDPSLAALTLEATTASPATMTREPQGRQAAPTSRQPQEENPVSDNSRVCAGTSRQLSSAPAPTSAPAHPRLLFSGLTASSLLLLYTSRSDMSNPRTGQPLRGEELWRWANMQEIQRVCAGTSRQLSSAPAHHALVYSNLCKGQTGRRRRETFVSRSRFPPYHYRPIPVLALNPLAYICLAGKGRVTQSHPPRAAFFSISM